MKYIVTLPLLLTTVAADHDQTETRHVTYKEKLERMNPLNIVKAYGYAYYAIWKASQERANRHREPGHIVNTFRYDDWKIRKEDLPDGTSKLSLINSARNLAVSAGTVVTMAFFAQ